MTDLSHSSAARETAGAPGGKPQMPSEIPAMPGKKPMSNLQARLITGVIIAVLTLGITWAGGPIFKVFCLCVGAAILSEWNAIIKAGAAPAAVWCSWLFYLALALALLLAPPAQNSAGLALAIAAAGIILAFLLAWRLGGVKQAALAAGGFCYAALFPLSFICLRLGAGLSAPAGLYLVLLLYVIVWAGDIGAYAFGRLIGGPKLAPKISPNKTWSGALGGLLCAVAAALGFVSFAGSAFAPAAGLLSPEMAVLAALILSVVAQAGDLLESRFKRAFGVKDSGRLLPGHGGVMDRVDGLLPAAFILAALLPLFYF